MEKVYFHSFHKNKLDALDFLADFYQKTLNDLVENYNKNNKYLFCSGDHSNAIAIWGAMLQSTKSDMGLIWVDAHLDSHTTETSESKNIHGMPVATLMGYGSSLLSSMISSKLKPANICFIATRDYEEAEIRLLEYLKVKIFFMKDISRSNIKEVFQEAYDYISKKASCFGVSLDIDSMDPSQMPATGCYNPGGLLLEDVVDNLSILSKKDNFLGLEITEYNPLKDLDGITFQGIAKIIKNCF